MTQSRNYYKRNLPHWHPVGKSLFLTWRLHGSLPQTVINQIRIARQRLRQQRDRDPEGTSDARLLEYKRLFAKVDSILDRATSGPLWLKVKEVASIVQDALLQRYAHLYTLSFDHWCRDKDEFSRIVKYIENNPVKAGLVKRPEEWPWSSAAERKRRGSNDFKALT